VDGHPERIVVEGTRALVAMGTGWQI
jgi:hypothetical protein